MPVSDLVEQAPGKASHMGSNAHRIALQTGATFALAVTLPTAAAQFRLATVPDKLLRPTSIAMPAAAAATPAPAPTLQAAAKSTTNYAGSAWYGSAVQLELPRDAGNGTYTRPKVIVGIPSDSMRTMMKSAGVTTKYCMLPMLRARTKMNGDGDINGTLWLYARCTFY
jgi:hypothetical protein